MESSGIPGRIQVTQDVVDLLEDTFFFEERGLITVKSKAEMVTSFLIGRENPSITHLASIETVPAKKPETILFDNNARLTLVEKLRTLESALMGTNTPSDSVDGVRAKAVQSSSLVVVPKSARTDSQIFHDSAAF